MTRLMVVCEGDTEYMFVENVLGPHLDARGVFTSRMIVETKRTPDGQKFRGGGFWGKWFKDIRRVCRDTGADFRVTTFFDLYGLPDDFPELTQHAHVKDTNARAHLLEQAMAAKVEDPRFVPYLQRHEHETLVLAALPQLAQQLNQAQLVGLQQLQANIGAVAPEDVNDGKATAPSKRLLSFIPGYRKNVHGPDATRSAGLTNLRAQCPRFDAWVNRLERL